MTTRPLAGVGVLLAALVAGLAFSTVFAASALLVPSLAVVLAVGLADVVVHRTPVPAALRAPLGSVLGAAVGLVALTVPEPPWGTASARVLDGLRTGWLRTLESTLPARPDPELMAFVPLLVLLAAVIGLEWLRRGIAPLVALLPSTTVLVLAQLFGAATGTTATLLACAYGIAVATVLMAGRGLGRSTGGVRTVVVLVLPVALITSGAAALFAIADPWGATAYSLRERFQLVPVPRTAVSPLAQLGGRLARPDDIAFTVATDAPVDRWTLVVLDGYDGVNWTSSAHYRPLGVDLPGDPGVRAGTGTFAADVTLATGLGGPWLPTQNRTASVTGLAPAVDETTGTLLLPDPGGAVTYTLRWRAPELAGDALVDTAVDPDAPLLAVGQLPAGIVAVADEVLHGAAPSFPAALALERWFADGHSIAAAGSPPTGHGDAQLLYFLDESRQGTSEQFAAAYTLVARAAGIPARLAVGFRQSGERDDSGRVVVRNRDAFAWPEVAVDGIGWVALDPTGGARQESDAAGSVSQAAAEARDRLPESGALAAPQPVGPTEVQPGPAAGASSLLGPAMATVAAALAVGVAWLVGVPTVKAVRRIRRRRREPGEAVVGAWLEARDRLRDHGVAVHHGMTVRDTGRAAAPIVDIPAGELERLARRVDLSLWSGTDTDRAAADEAWESVSAVDGALACRPASERVRAALRLRTLTEPRS